MPQNKRSNVSFVFLQLMWVRTSQEQSAVALWDPFCWKNSRYYLDYFVDEEKPVFRASLALSMLEIELYQISHFQ